MRGQGADRSGRDWSDALCSALREAHDHGFLGPGPVEAHVRHAVGFVRAYEDCRVEAPARVADLGSGGGVPALVLIEMWPATSFLLIDSNKRRADFLERVVATLRTRDCPEATARRGSLEVSCSRAEDVGRGPMRASYDLVTARSFGPPAVTAECAAPLLRAGGVLIVSEPPDSDGRRWPATGLANLGLGVGGVRGEPFSFFVAEQVSDCPPTYPRRVGVPGRRPLF